MIFKFSEVFEDVTKFSKKTKKKDYLSDGKIAIIDQSKSHIAGYTNDRNKTYKGKLPAIIFGDHTRNRKFLRRWQWVPLYVDDCCSKHKLPVTLLPACFPVNEFLCVTMVCKLDTGHINTSWQQQF